MIIVRFVRLVLHSTVEDVLPVTDLLSDDDGDSSPVCCRSMSVEGWDPASAIELSENLHDDDDFLVAVATATAAAAAPAWLLHVDDVGGKRNPLLRGDCMWCDADLFQRLLTMSTSSSSSSMSSSKAADDDIDCVTTLSVSGQLTTNQYRGRDDDNGVNRAAPPPSPSPVDRRVCADGRNSTVGTLISGGKGVSGAKACRWLGQFDAVNMGIEIPLLSFVACNTPHPVIYRWQCTVNTRVEDGTKKNEVAINLSISEITLN